MRPCAVSHGMLRHMAARKKDVGRGEGAAAMEKAGRKGNFSNNVIWYNFILCILVVFIHARNDGVFTSPVWILGVPVFNWAEAFLAADIAGAAVGGFFLCSGYLFFRSYSWNRVLDKYKSRAQSLLVPYILWTLIYYFIHAAISHIPVLAKAFHEPPLEMGWQTAVDAVLNYRYCAFLWFLQFLILYAAASPAVYLLIRSRYAGAAAILVVLFTACTNIIKNEQAAAVTNWLALYMLGGYIGVHWKNAIESKMTGTKQLVGTLLLATAAFWINKRFPSVFGVLSYSVAFSAALWCLLAWDKSPAKENTMPAAREWQKNTFAVYMSHFMIVQGANALVGRYVSQSMWVGMALFLSLPAICFGAVYLAKKICGNGKWIIWKRLMGSR